MTTNKAAAGSDTGRALHLPGLDCGLCGSRTCHELAARLIEEPDLIKRCTPLAAAPRPEPPSAPDVDAHPIRFVARPPRIPGQAGTLPSGIPGPGPDEQAPWRDGLGRDFDFFLEHFPEEAGPREIILPHNPLLTRELQIAAGDVLIGRPLGMSCGCPVTHCGVATAVDPRTGVITWCVTGPLEPRRRGAKDIGYYAAEAYEGLIHERRCEIRIGMRYFFQPRMCMLQWRHSGLVNYMNKTAAGLQVRLEGLWIG